VVPVVQRDIYRPHEVEHVKREVHIHHEPPVIVGTKVAEPVSVQEWESKSGHKITGAAAGKEKERAGSSSSSSSSSSSDEESRRTGVKKVKKTKKEKTHRKKGVGEKMKEAVGLDTKDPSKDPKDQAYLAEQQQQQQQAGTTGEQRHKSLGEKAKEAVGLEPKQGAAAAPAHGSGITIPNRFDQTQGSSTGGVGFVESQRKKIGEKAKEVVGLDLKDPSKDPKDIGYASEPGHMGGV
jgi:hypothetical protein